MSTLLSNSLISIETSSFMITSPLLIKNKYSSSQMAFLTSGKLLNKNFSTISL